MECDGVPSDTSAEVERRLIEALRRLSPEERAERLGSLCRAADELAIAGMELREGPLEPHTRRVRLARLRYGSTIVDAALEKLRARADHT